jgi:hypothetical protein
VKHGGRWSYDDAGCRCLECRAANAARQAQLRARKAAASPAVDPKLRHGSASTYANHKCRCTACVEAKRVENGRRFA